MALRCSLASCLGPNPGDVVVTSDFDAKNAFGTEIGYRAKCYFKPGVAAGEVEISQRLR